MTKEDKTELAEMLAASKPKPFSNVPGGPAGAVATLAIVVFFAKDYFGDFKDNSQKLAQVSAQQQLILQQVGVIKEAVDDLEIKTAKRYTSEDAGKDLGILQRQINMNTTVLDDRSSWMDSIDDRIDILEMHQKQTDLRSTQRQ
jgi:hypothetical protein